MKKGSFQAQLNQFSVDTVDRCTRLHRAVSIELFNSVIKDTPVDTGRLAANWRTSLNHPVLTQTESTGRGAAYTEVEEGTKGSTAADKIILTNSLPYAYRVEYEGWSHTKAPQGMVQRNIIRFKKILKDQLTIARYQKK